MKNKRGNALLVVLIVIIVASIGIAVSLRNASNRMLTAGESSRDLTSRFTLETSIEAVQNELQRRLTGTHTNLRLPEIDARFFPPDAPQPDPLGILSLLDPEIFQRFPQDQWVSPYSPDIQIKLRYQVLSSRRTPYPLGMDLDVAYEIEAKQEQSGFVRTQLEKKGRFNLNLQGAPYTRYFDFINSLRRQDGTRIRYASRNGARRTIFGPVHTNGDFYTSASPIFKGFVSFGGNWNPLGSDDAGVVFHKNRDANYDCEGQTPCVPDFQKGSQHVMPISLPTNIFSTERMALGGGVNYDPSLLEEAVIKQKTNGRLPDASRFVPPNDPTQTAKPGIYLQSYSGEWSNGIYVVGDINRVEFEALDFNRSDSPRPDFLNSSNFSQIDSSCSRYQKFTVEAAGADGTGGYDLLEFYLTDKDCIHENTFVRAPRQAGDSSREFLSLSGHGVGVIYATGKVKSVRGPHRRNGAAILRDFALTVAAAKDVYITGEIQYEDVKYFQVADGNIGDVAIGNAFGPYDNAPTDCRPPECANIVGQMDANSNTMLGILSGGGHIGLIASGTHHAPPTWVGDDFLGDDGLPPNANLHMAMMAAGSGCTTPSWSSGTDSGCGSGLVDYAAQNLRGLGALKRMGANIFFRSLSVGSFAANPPLGYDSGQSVWDSRLAEKTPPGFPVSPIPMSRLSFLPFDRMGVVASQELPTEP